MQSSPFNFVQWRRSVTEQHLSERKSRVGSVSELWSSSMLLVGLNGKRRFKTWRSTPVYESSFPSVSTSFPSVSARLSPLLLSRAALNEETLSPPESRHARAHTASCTAPSGRCWKHTNTITIIYLHGRNVKRVNGPERMWFWTPPPIIIIILCFETLYKCALWSIFRLSISHVTVLS